MGRHASNETGNHLMSSPAASVSVRYLEPGDAEPLRQIYNHAVLSSTATLDIEPRSPSDQERWLELHMGVYPTLVAVCDEQPIGYASISPFRPRAGYNSTVEDSVYIDPKYQGQGIGRLLLERLLATATSLGFHSCIAHIVADHKASLNLHLACGFTLVGVEREIGRKFGRWIDMAILQRQL
ncbi:MAG: GNAT family N-acetyltransferase [Ferrimicrobium sp.]|uniref:N-acetyltransferase family protein n=2 Tax=Ferrimicrobium TaxID=121038 RepID=A0ABV3Y1Z1_9ACTN|nr:GNAT family N-acetyltransferase [Ferrimicrobium sp.]